MRRKITRNQLRYLNNSIATVRVKEAEMNAGTRAEMSDGVIKHKVLNVFYMMV